MRFLLQGKTLVLTTAVAAGVTVWPVFSAWTQPAEKAGVDATTGGPDAAKGKAKAKAGAKQKQKRPRPQLTGLAAIMFEGASQSSTAPEAPATAPKAVPLPEAAVPSQPVPTPAPIAEPVAAPAPETTAAAPPVPALVAPPEAAVTPPAVTPENVVPEKPEKPAEPAVIQAAAPIVAPLSGEEKNYPFLSEDVAALIDTDMNILDTLPNLEPPVFDPDLLQFGMSYSIGGGTGTLPGATAEVARCGVAFDPSAASSGSSSGSPSADVPAGIIASYSVEDQRSWLMKMGNPTCCSFDAQTSAYRCGSPNSFPNRVDTFTGPGGDQMMMVCVPFSEDDAQLFHQEGITYVDGSAVRTGQGCCAVSLTYLDAWIPSASGEPDFKRLVAQCAPSSVAQASSMGNAGGKFAASTEIYGEGSLQMFSERRHEALRFDTSDRLSLISHFESGNTSNNLRGTFARLNGTYRRYLTDEADPWFVEGGGNFDGTTFDVPISKPSGSTAESVYNWPVRVVLGGGKGRIYDIEPRIRLRKLEAMLLDQGIIRQKLSDDVARKIMIAWWMFRGDLGYDRHLLYTLKILKDAGLLVGPIDVATVYRFGQILNDSQLMQRRQGYEWGIELSFRKTLQKPVDDLTSPDLQFVISAHDQRVYNLTYDTELFWDVGVAIAPRSQDWADNTLPGKQVPLSGLTGGMLAFTVPVGYRMYDYDEFLNKRGVLELAARVAGGYANDASVTTAPDGVGLAIGGSVKYALFSSASQGVSFTVDTTVGVLNKKLVYSMTGGITMMFGHAESYYVAPGGLGDALPFDLPLPDLVTGN